MIKFFRKIRQKLITENKFSKYLIYALGEIILVVIVILIALQLNNLNETIKINNEVEQSLNKLFDESETIIKSLQDDLDFKDTLIGCMDQIAIALQNKTLENIGSDTIELGISGIGYYKALNLPNSVYNELFNSGKLQNIKSENIQTSISKYYSNLEYIQSQLPYFRSSAQTMEIDMHTDSHLYVYDPSAIRKIKFKPDVEALMNDNNFKSRQVYGLRNQIVFKTYLSDLLISAQIMRDAIATEL